MGPKTSSEFVSTLMVLDATGYYWVACMVGNRSTSNMSQSVSQCIDVRMAAEFYLSKDLLTLCMV